MLITPAHVFFSFLQHSIWKKPLTQCLKSLYLLGVFSFFGTHQTLFQTFEPFNCFFSCAPTAPINEASVLWAIAYNCANCFFKYSFCGLKSIFKLLLRVTYRRDNSSKGKNKSSKPKFKALSFLCTLAGTRDTELRK